MKTSLLLLVTRAFSFMLMWLTSSMSLAESQRVIVDMSRYNHTVMLFSMHADALEKKIVLSEVGFFSGSQQGSFLARKNDGTWITGNVFDGSTPKQIDKVLVPEQYTNAAISHDGNGIIWTTTDGKRCNFFLTDLRKQKNYQIRTKTGVLAYPSWSFDNRHIAYYSGFSWGADGYSLCVMDIPELGKASIDTMEWEEHVITPPSELTRLNAERSAPPLWSPDNTRLLFEARYDGHGVQYVVNMDGSGLRPIPGSYTTWSVDGTLLYTVMMTIDKKLGPVYTAVCVDEKSGKTLNRLFANPPELTADFSIAPDGTQYLAFTTKYIAWITIRSGAVKELVACPVYCPVIWANSSMSILKQ